MLYASQAQCQKIRYGGLQQLSLIIGQNSSFGFTMVNGIRFHKFFTGLGADAQFTGNRYYYDFNPYNTSAAFADVRYYINKNNNFFGKINAGVNMLRDKMSSSSTYNYKKLAGYYFAFGLGFKAKLGKEVFYTFDVSYCLRQTRYNYNYVNFIKEWQTEKNDLRQFAIMVNMGFEIF